MTVQTNARNATLADIQRVLEQQQAAKLDVVVGSQALGSKDGKITVRGTEEVILQEAQITEDGVDAPVTISADGAYLPTTTFDGNLADRLDVPVRFLRRMRAERTDLYDGIVNGLLHGRQIRRVGGEVETIAEPDPRKFFLRLFKSEDGNPGVARAMLSDTFAKLDNLDFLVALLAGVRDSGVNVTADNMECDLTENRMYVKITVPEIAALAPVLGEGYRSPFRDAAVEAQRAELNRWRGVAAREGMGYEPGTEPVVWAGLVASNSEIGEGRWTVTPRIVFQPCKNGLTIPAMAYSRVHVGARLEEGFRWSADTQRKALDLVAAKTRDAVATFLNVDFVKEQVTALEYWAGRELTSPMDTVEKVTTKLGFTTEQRAGVLDHFLRGGQVTAGGVMQAITSFTQTIPDADTAYALEGKAVEAMALAAHR